LKVEREKEKGSHSPNRRERGEKTRKKKKKLSTAERKNQKRGPRKSRTMKNSQQTINGETEELAEEKKKGLKREQHCLALKFAIIPGKPGERKHLTGRGKKGCKTFENWRENRSQAEVSLERKEGKEKEQKSVTR